MTASVTPALLLADDPLPLIQWPDGTIRVRDSRLLLDTVVHAYNGGASAEEIAGNYGPTPLCDILSVLAYYERHRREVDAYLAARDTSAEEYWHKIEGGPAHAAFVARVMGLTAEREAPPPD